MVWGLKAAPATDPRLPAEVASSTCVCEVKGDPMLKQYDNSWLILRRIGSDICLISRNTPADNALECEFQVEAGFSTFTSGAIGHVDVSIKRGTDTHLISVQAFSINNTPPGSATTVNLGDGSDAMFTWQKVGSTWLVTVNDAVCGDLHFSALVDLLNPANTLVGVGVPRVDAYLANIAGLCGNCDNTMNDYTLSNGTDIAFFDNKFTLLGDDMCAP